jgi:prevent-host-death family protein
MNMQEAKTNLSKLVSAALAGDEVIIANRGQAIARLVPYEVPQKRELGFVKGSGEWDDSFFEPLPEEELQLWGA